MGSTDTALVDRYRAIAAKIPPTVTLVAVSKTHPFEKIASLYAAGHRDFGENYVQELLEKAKLARERGMNDIRWHFIGHLQTNKVKALLPEVSLIHGVDSERLATEISKRTQPGKKTPILLEVNIDSQESKSGVGISELRKLAEHASRLPGVEVLGLMCIPDPNREEGSLEAFRRLSALEADLRPLTRGVLSMGMTSDFEKAIAAGSTLVRVGTAIFGEREKRSE